MHSISELHVCPPACGGSSQTAEKDRRAGFFILDCPLAPRGQASEDPRYNLCHMRFRWGRSSCEMGLLSIHQRKRLQLHGRVSSALHLLKRTGLVCSRLPKKVARELFERCQFNTAALISMTWWQNLLMHISFSRPPCASFLINRYWCTHPHIFVFLVCKSRNLLPAKQNRIIDGSTIATSSVSTFPTLYCDVPQ